MPSLTTANHTGARRHNSQRWKGISIQPAAKAVKTGAQTRSSEAGILKPKNKMLFVLTYTKSFA